MCKHLNGVLMEISDVLHIRGVKEGIVDCEGVNEIGGIKEYTFKCYDCGKVYLFYNSKKDPLWFKRLYSQL